MLVKVVWKLQLLHSVAARLLWGAGIQGSITPLLKKLHKHLVGFCAHVKVVVLTLKKGLKSLESEYLKDCLLPPKIAYLLRFFEESFSCLPPASRADIAEGRLCGITAPLEFPAKGVPLCPFPGVFVGSEKLSLDELWGSEAPSL